MSSSQFGPEMYKLIESKDYINSNENIDYSNEFKHLINIVEYTGLYKNNNNQIKVNMCNKLASLTRNNILLSDFQLLYRNLYCPDTFIEIVPYINALIENDGNFCVNLDELINFGFITRRDDIGYKIIKNYKINVDYLLRHLAEQSETSRGVKHKNIYIAKPLL